MSPKRITQMALIVGGVSLVGLPVMLILSPDWGIFSWWPGGGLLLALLLVGLAFGRGFYLTAQKQVYMVDLLNDCYRAEKPGTKH